MPGKIRVLSDEVIGKIAAGEVVERPSAAIKEMVENSLDAGATAITVEIRDGGISYFRVTDNGSGIAQSEIRIAFERHATSKLSNAKELEAIQTLGFRGEALASIAAVSRVTCTTRTKKDSSGIKLVNVAGKIESIEEAACPEGTSFVVRDLFFNTPVRLKFLKKPATEAGYVSDLMMRMILSRPDVSFRYINQGKTLYHSAGDGKLSSAVFSIYGKEVRSMREVSGHQSGILLKGFVGVGNTSRATRSHQSFFINGRYMKSPLLSSALEAACKEHNLQGKYPSCVLHLTMPYDMVDVNVHPNKLECRFQSETTIATAVESIIADAFAPSNPLEKPIVLSISADNSVPATPVSVRKQETVSQNTAVQDYEKKQNQEVKQDVAPSASIVVNRMTVAKPAIRTPEASQHSAGNESEAKKPAIAILHSQTNKGQPSPVTHLKPLQPTTQNRPAILHEPSTAVQTYMQSYQPIIPPVCEKKAKDQSVSGATSVPQSFLPELPKTLKIIGSAFDCYILAEYDDKLLLIDQQGVHERLLFDKMMKALDTNSCSQELLIPIIVPATRKEQQLLENHKTLLEGIGLNVEAFGDTEVSIRSIPMILGQPQAAGLLREILDQLESERGIISLEKRRAGIVALACKKSVRSGEHLNESDLRDLVEQMVSKKIVPTSPRGMPLIVALSHSDIDRRFRRPQ